MPENYYPATRRDKQGRALAFSTTSDRVFNPTTGASVRAEIGEVSSLSTTAKTVVPAINENKASIGTLNQNLAGTGMQLKRWDLSVTTDAGGAAFITLPSGVSATESNCTILSVVCKTAGYLAAVRPMLTPQGYWIFTLVDGSGAVKSSTAATFVIIAGIVGG